ncbi:MAG: hypothetical protein MJZ69_05920 [Bacteroidaceae bacterium]|nr:hypothetical protein [Bacteroidaceae bacterium]
MADTTASAPRVKKHKSGIEKALDDVKHGRVYKAESVDDMFKHILENASPNKTTMNAIKEVKKGQVVEYASLDDFKKRMYEL